MESSLTLSSLGGESFGMLRVSFPGPSLTNSAWKVQRTTKAGKGPRRFIFSFTGLLTRGWRAIFYQVQEEGESARK